MILKIRNLQKRKAVLFPQMQICRTEMLCCGRNRKSENPNAGLQSAELTCKKRNARLRSRKQICESQMQVCNRQRKICKSENLSCFRQRKFAGPKCRIAAAIAKLKNPDAGLQSAELTCKSEM